MLSKFQNLEDVVSLVGSYDFIAISGDMKMSPMSFIREMVRQKIQDVTLLFPGAAAINADFLIGARVARQVEFSQISLGEFGFAPNFRREVEMYGLRCVDHSCPALLAGLQAGAMGIPFIPVRGLIGTDYLQVRHDFKVIVNPFNTKEDIAVVPAIQPDIAVFHALQADTLGNVVVSRTQNNHILAQAATSVIVTVEEVVEPAELKRDRGVFIPATHITAVVHAPYGAHPTGCDDYYPIDSAHIRAYAKITKTREGFANYLKKYVFKLGKEKEYVDLVLSEWKMNEESIEGSVM
jgi:glutaconate CoA-transferase subunit A